jgi:hypothetical protein
MKDILKNGSFILLLVAVLYILFLRECKHPLPCPPEDKVLIPKTAWDSILALANKPPEVRIDTVWLEKPLVNPDPQPPMPDPIFVDSTITDYKDSLVNKEINVYYDFKVKGTLLSRNWSYKPIEVYITRDSIVYVPKIVEIEKPVETLRNALFGYGIVGGNQNSFLFGGGLDFVTKKGTQIGYQYQRFGVDNFHSVKFGVKIRLKK